jgi:hypothetical protein
VIAPRAALGLLVLFLAGCRNEKALPVGPSDPPDPSATFQRVQREVFSPSCALAGCHAGAAPVLSLTLEEGKAWRSLVGVVSVETNLLRVFPSLPNDSYLVVKLRGDAAILGARMPSGGAPLSPEALRLVVDWVSRGAPND